MVTKTASGVPGATSDERWACNMCSTHTCCGCLATPPWPNPHSRLGREMSFAFLREVQGLVQGHGVQRSWHLQVCAFPAASACLSERAKLNTLTDTKFIFPGLLFQNGYTNYWPFFLVILIIRNTFFSVAFSLSAYYRNKALLKPTG